MRSVLITGATGLIGTSLSNKLREKDYEVRVLSRSKKKEGFYWDPSQGKIDKEAFENLDFIIHLAGATISKRWTKSYKKELYDSRVKTAQLLYDTAKKANTSLKKIITASGANYYGTLTSEKIFKESDPHVPDFLGKLCYDLENTIQQFETIGAKVCAVRTSAVLSPKGGMLKELLPLANNYLISPLGNGKQIVPWIHIDDIVNLYIHLLENEELHGAYNAAGSQIVNNKEFTYTFAKSLNKKVILPSVPGFFLKTVLGEMSSILLEGSAVSNSKIKTTGFQFQFDQLDIALDNLLAQKNR